jgi:hypothetical protein
MATRRDLIAAANMALSATGASLVVVAHDNGLASMAARADLTPEQAAITLRHLADHVDGTAECCGDQPMPLRLMPPC